MKTPLKTSEKKNLEKGIKAIMAQAPTTIQATWEDQGKIEWSGDAIEVLPDGIVQALPKDLRRKMATLYGEHRIGMIF